MAKVTKNQATKLQVKQVDKTLEPVGKYMYMPLVSMSVTKEEVAQRPVLVVDYNPEQGYLLMPLSTKNLDEMWHEPLVLPGSEKLSYLAVNQHYYLKTLPNLKMQKLPQKDWQQVLTTLKKVSKLCKVNQQVNASLNDWLNTVPTKTTKVLAK
jgi:hypothetical protein